MPPKKEVPPLRPAFEWIKENFKEYWSLFIEGIVKDVAILPAMISLGHPIAILSAIIIYAADVYVLWHSITKDHSPKLLITFLLTEAVKRG